MPITLLPAHMMWHRQDLCHWNELTSPYRVLCWQLLNRRITHVRRVVMPGMAKGSSAACPAITYKAGIQPCWCACRVWLAFLANTALITGPLVLAQNPVSTLKETASEAKSVRSGRGKLFLILAAFFFVEGLGILAHPTLAQRVSHPPLQAGSRCLFREQGQGNNSKGLVCRLSHKVAPTTATSRAQAVSVQDSACHVVRQGTAYVRMWL